jgi:hypothetical protein
MYPLTPTRQRSSSALVRLLVAAVIALLLGTFIVLPALSSGSGTWTLTGSLHAARSNATATLLINGQVLVAGGSLASAELYNPATGTWTTTGSMHQARWLFTLTLLQNGQVLAVGGQDSPSFLNSTELFTP